LGLGETGGPPYECGASVGDIFPGTLTLVGILLALRIREATGMGQYVDTSMYDAMISLNERALVNYELTGVIPTHGKEALLLPHGAFKTNDGYVVIAVFTLEHWLGVCKAMGREDLAADPNLKTGIDRAMKAGFLRPIMEEWTSQRSKKEVTESLLAAGTPAGPAQNAKDILDCPHAQARNMIVEIDDPVAGKLRMQVTR
jgi:crotonobetainyl-CoA:carnitine CoA-transferase CaiB-like acyl-CoA transferase